jgi:hypothetical protein
MLPPGAVVLTGGFWSQRQQTNRQVALRHGYQMLEQAGNFQNFRLAAGLAKGQYQGPVFMDSDIYKWLEAVAYELHQNPDAELQKLADEVIDLVGSAQQSNGYLNTYYQVVEPDGHWSDLDFGHELYCAGHLFQAAVAYYRATATGKLLAIATRFADLLCTIFGPDKRPGAPGHPEIEMALVELYRLTNQPAYLEMAKFFIDQRGKGVMRGLGWAKAEYHQDRVPVRQAAEVEGHAVRAMYLNAGVTDLYLETGEPALLTALERQWRDMVETKLHLTGGLGARYEGESFGDPYELPADRCYCETCAAIGGIMWNWRMLLVTGESRFADLMEQTLYNGFLSGLALDGRHFFYMNPLLNRGGYERQAWYKVACCPPNIMRLLASLGYYFVTRDETGLQLHLYNPAVITTELASGRAVALSVQTDYPWQGQVKITLQEADGSSWRLRLRLPSWCADVQATLNGQPVEQPKLEAGYLALERAWQPGDMVELSLGMQPYLVEANPRVDAIRGSVAIQRGPLVYCLEAIDQPDLDLLDLQFDETAPLQAVWREDLLPEGVVVVETTGYTPDDEDWQGRLYRRLNPTDTPSRRRVPLTAIPYYAWANRGPNMMRVWMPRARPA